ncbi:MAG: GAF domain-containing protein [Chloroflexi bacterium]|nr:GAF domain-containing protein [Chloroflexota bacterium]
MPPCKPPAPKRRISCSRDGDHLTCRAAKRKDQTRAVPANVVATDPLAAMAIKNARSLVADAERLKRIPGAPNSAAYVPVMIQDRVLGAMGIRNLSPDSPQFTTHHAALLSALSDYAAIALENARNLDMLRSNNSVARAAVLRLLAANMLVVLAAVLTACAPSVSLLPARSTSTPAISAAQAISVPTLTGAIDQSLSGTAASVNDPDIGIALYLEGERYAVNLVLPHDIVVGTHSIASLLSAYDSQQRVRFVGVSITDDIPPADSILPFALYANVLQGRSTLTSIEPLTGAFEVTASDDLGATVTATGTFNAIVRPAPQD